MAFEKHTGTIRIFLQYKPATIVAEPGELLDEILFAQALEGRNLRDFGFGQSHLPWPAAASGATLTFEEDRHA